VPVESFRQFAPTLAISPARLISRTRWGILRERGPALLVVRVANKDAAAGAGAASVAVADTAGRVVFRVFASSPGTWGNALTIENCLSSQAQTAIGLPDQGTPRYATVDSVAQFERSTLARIEQVRHAAALPCRLGRRCRHAPSLLGSPARRGGFSRPISRSPAST
jgi:hypothetical protein